MDFTVLTPYLLLLAAGIEFADSQFQYFTSCDFDRDCPMSQYCDRTLGKPAMCAPCINCNSFNRNFYDYPCVTDVLTQCGTCIYGYTDMTGFGPGRLEKCQMILDDRYTRRRGYRWNSVGLPAVLSANLCLILTMAFAALIFRDR